MSKGSTVRNGKPRPAPAKTRRGPPERTTTDYGEHQYEDLVESLDGIVWEIEPKDFRVKFVSEQCELEAKVLGVGGRTEALAKAIKLGILSPQ